MPRTHASGSAHASPGVRYSHAPRAYALSRAPSRTLARAPLLAPAARTIATQAAGLRATPTRPPRALDSLREDFVQSGIDLLRLRQLQVGGGTVPSKRPPREPSSREPLCVTFLCRGASKARCPALVHLTRATKCLRSFGAHRPSAADIPAPQSSGDAALLGEVQQTGHAHLSTSEDLWRGHRQHLDLSPYCSVVGRS